MKKRGFSLVEIVVVLGILAIMMYIFAEPALRWYYQYELYKEAQRLNYALNYAKNYAISNSVYTSLCISNNSIQIYNNGLYLNNPCAGTLIQNYTLPNYESYISYTQSQNAISFDARGLSSQNGNVCVYASNINMYYMMCVSYAGIRETSGTGYCPTNC